MNRLFKKRITGVIKGYFVERDIENINDGFWENNLRFIIQRCNSEIMGSDYKGNKLHLDQITLGREPLDCINTLWDKFSCWTILSTSIPTSMDVDQTIEFLVSCYEKSELINLIK